MRATRIIHKYITNYFLLLWQNLGLREGLERNYLIYEVMKKGQQTTTLNRKAGVQL